MQTELAVVVSADWPSCIVRSLESSDQVDAVNSATMQEHYIRVRAGDLVRVDFAAQPAEVTRRHGWRATITGVDGDRVKFDSLPNGTAGTAVVPPELELTLAVGDAVLIRDSQAPVVVDVVAEDGPAHPEWFDVSQRAICPP